MSSFFNAFGSTPVPVDQGSFVSMAKGGVGPVPGADHPFPWRGRDGANAYGPGSPVAAQAASSLRDRGIGIQPSDPNAGAYAGLGATKAEKRAARKAAKAARKAAGQYRDVDGLNGLYRYRQYSSGSVKILRAAPEGAHLIGEVIDPGTGQWQAITAEIGTWESHVAQAKAGIYAQLLQSAGKVASSAAKGGGRRRRGGGRKRRQKSRSGSASTAVAVSEGPNWLLWGGSGLALLALIGGAVALSRRDRTGT